MNALLDILNWLLLLLSLSGMALLLRSLSRRLGEALHMRKYYFLYDASVAVLAVSTAVMLLGRGSPGAGLLFLFGAILIVGVTVRYWGWILPEIFKRSK